jgi:hypothetical protein
MLGPTLDRRLALGQPPERSRFLAARAVWLVSAHARSRLASDWRRLVDAAGIGDSAGTRAVRIRQTEMRVLEPEVRAVIEGLVGRGPVPARGVAMANTLLTDGAGPLYHGHGTSALRTALRMTAEELDAAAPLL